MQNTQDCQDVALELIDGDKGRSIDHKFTRSGHAAMSPDFRMLLQDSRLRVDLVENPLSRDGILPSNVCRKFMYIDARERVPF